MLNPEDPVLKQHAELQAAGPDAPADYHGYIKDAESLKDLLRHRHIAVVLDPDKVRIVNDIIDRWTRYLSEEMPTTLAGCAGVLGEDLGKALNDAHLHVRHGHHHRTSKNTFGDDAGPAWEAATLNGLRTIRIRTLDGSDAADSVLRAGAAQHAEDFTFQDIVVDLRGNGGGDDSYVTTWFAPHVNTSWTIPCQEQGMTLSASGSSIAYWNYAAWLSLNHHSVPEAFTAQHLRPHHDSHIITTAPGDGGITRESPIPAGTSPWMGRMIVAIDGGTGSSGESAALLLKSAFNAVLVGTPSYGVIDYGNSTPYYLPTSGMEIHLPAQANHWGTTTDFIGIQPDVPLPATTPLHDITAKFDRLHAAGLNAPTADHGRSMTR